MLRQFVSIMGDGTILLQIMAYITLILSGLSILVALSSSILDRKKESALLRVIGAKRRTVFLSVI
ncbi:FtsX-like permease family protein [Natranaerobius trueperi]|nr:FtsX-like permease family protein [Natranaerobius trueperi]